MVLLVEIYVNYIYNNTYIKLNLEGLMADVAGLDFETLEKIDKSFEMIDKRFGGNTSMKREILIRYGLSLDDFPTVFKSSPIAKETQEKALEVQEQAKKDLELQNKLVYGDKWYVLQNRLLNAITDLDLNERRLIMFLSPMVRKDVENYPNKHRRVFIVRALDFAETYEIKPNNVYKVLAKTADTILRKAFWFWNFKDDKPFGEKTYKTGMTWVSKCNYLEEKGEIAVSLSEDMIEMLTVFDKANPFTKYQIDVIVKLGCYGIILFELIVSCLYQNFRKKSYTIEYLKEKFNCVDSYSNVAEFKRNVIDRAIKEIHEHTSICVSYGQKKVGRRISELVFSFEDTTQDKIENTKEKIDSIKEKNPFVNFKMTQKQLALFAIKIHQLNYQDIDDILDELCNVHLQINHVDSLKQLGFVPSAWYSDDEAKSHLTAEQIAEAEKAEQLQRAEQEQLKRKQQQEQAEAERLAKEKAEQDFIDYFESLPVEIQELALDLTYDKVKVAWGKHFKKDRENGKAHKMLTYRAELKRNIEQALVQLG